MSANAQSGFTCPCQGIGVNYNVDAAGRTLTNIIASGDLPASLPSGSCVAILGLMRVDKAYTMSGITLKMQPGAEISVEMLVSESDPFPVLTISNANISGCETMWRAITVRRGTLQFEGNFVSDAQWAVRSGCGATPNCSGSRILNIIGNVFDRNHIGIHTRSTGNAFPAVAHNLTIHSNRFICSGALLPRFDNAATVENYLSTSTFAAIDIQSTTTGFDIGTANSAEANLIEGDNRIRNGILFRRCNGVQFNVRHAYISNLVGGVGTGAVNLTSPQGIGILIDATRGNPTVLIANSSSTASDRGIYSANGTFTAVNNAFSDDFIAIHHVGVNPITVAENTFTEYQFMGVRVASANTSSNLVIDKNVFTHSHAVFQDPTITPQSTGIAVVGVDPTNGGNGNKSISLNDFEIDSHDVAINILGDARFSLEFNDVEYGNGGAGFINEQGIIHVNGNDHYLYGNNIVTDTDTKTGNAFSVVAGLRNILCCNSVNRSGKGVYFAGYCDDSKLRYTNFGGDHPRSLFCDQATVIGDQILAGNLWQAPFLPGVQTVEHLGSGGEITGSRFFITPPINTPPLWPDIIIPSGGWFFDILGTGNSTCEVDTLCESALNFGEEQEGITENNRFAALSEYDAPRYGPMLTWEARRALYAKLAQNPALLGQEAEIDQFYHTTASVDLVDLVDLWQQGLEIGQLTTQEKATLQLLQTQLTDWQQERLIVESELSQPHSSESYAQLINQLVAIDSAMAQANQTILSIYDAERTRSQTIASTLAAQNGALTSALLLSARNEQALNQVYWEQLANGASTLTTDQFGVVAAIAHQCPLDGGHAVYRARAMYELHQPGSGFNDSILCASPPQFFAEEIPSHMANTTESEVFPNPAENILYVRLPTEEALGKVIDMRLYGMTGQLVWTSTHVPEDQLLSLRLPELPNGTYTLQLILNGNLFGAHRVVVLK